MVSPTFHILENASQPQFISWDWNLLGYVCNLGQSFSPIIAIHYQTETSMNSLFFFSSTPSPHF